MDVCVYIYIHICNGYVLMFAQLCPTLCDLMDCSPPSSSVRGIFQARILEWVAISLYTCVFIYTQEKDLNELVPKFPLGISGEKSETGGSEEGPTPLVILFCIVCVN